MKQKEKVLFNRACIDVSGMPILIPLDDYDERMSDSEMTFDSVEEAEEYCQKNDIFIVNETDIQFFDKNNVLISNI